MKTMKVSWFSLSATVPVFFCITIAGCGGSQGEDTPDFPGTPEAGIDPEILSAVGPNRCLDVAGGRPDIGTDVRIWDCNGSAAQRWTLTVTGEVRSAVAPNRCLDVAGGRPELGTNVRIWDCNGSNAQRWTYSENREFISAVAADRCLDVAGGRPDIGTDVRLWECNGSNAQQWTLR